MNLRIGAILLTCCLFPALAGADEVEQALKQFEGKVLVLRHPLEGSSLHYDAEGKVLKGGDEGPWTIYGGVLVDKISLSADALRIDGRRMLFLFEKQQLVLRELKRKGRHGTPFPALMQLEIKLDRAPGSAEQAHTVLGRVFALNTADLLDSVPDFWRGSLRNRLTYDPAEKQKAEFLWQPPSPPPPAVPEPARNAALGVTICQAGADTPLVFHVGAEVKAPKPTFTPEPEYPEIARYEEFQGVAVVNVIVGIDGKLHSIKLVHPLGLGLDDSAYSMLQTWRFHPATRDGQPVAVEMNIEVAFHLF